MKPKELSLLFGKLQSMPLREHDKFSLNLLKAIAKTLAPPMSARKQKTDYARIDLPGFGRRQRKGSMEVGYGSDGPGGSRKGWGRRGGRIFDD